MRRRVAAVWAAVAVVVVGGCTTDSEPAVPPDASSAPTAAPPRTEDAAASAALAAYTEYWRITDAALAAPGAQDWQSQIEGVARGQALHAALDDLENYRSIPGHNIGTISREPSVAEAGPTRVTILDCVDLGDTRLVSDATGDRLDDITNRVQRFRLHSQVVAGESGRWLVERVTPALDQPC